MKMERRESQISGYIKRYPFNGRSKYLIDKFYIIGYNAPTLNKLIFSKEINNNNNLSKYIILNEIEEEKNRSSSNNLQPFHFEEDPIILSELASDFGKKCLNYDIMKDMIFPNKISLYYLEEDLPSSNKEKGKNKEKEDNVKDNFIIYEENEDLKSDLLKTSCVIFSSNPQTENNSKKSINGFAYIFYKKLKRKKFTAKKIYSFYIPVIFTIVSEFPFYNSFYKLCEQIKNLFNLPNNEIPMEIMLYNIIKFTQSPINRTIILSIKSFLFQLEGNETQQKTSKNIETVIEEEANDDEDFKDRILDDSNILSKKINFSSEIKFDDSKISIQKQFKKKNSEIISHDKIYNFGKSESNKIKSSKSGNILRKSKKKKNMENGKEEEINLDKLFPNIKFELLPGYPLIQYNLAKVLLDTMSPINVIKIFFYTFLEKNVIFFSKNLELLSLTINSYMILNFPLNDEKYYFINASVSLENYINNNSPFIGATFANMSGINSSYNTKYLNSTNKLTEHIAIDLDEDNIYEVDDNGKKDDIKKNKEFFSYIKKICKKEVKNEKSQTILSREVYLLYKKLNEINNLLHNNDNELENNEAFKLFKNGDYMDYDDSKNNYIRKQNIEIQNAFYRLLNSLCLYFYQHLELNTSGDDRKENKNKKKDNNNKDEMNVIFKDKEFDPKVYNDKELFFIDELRQTMKYESFVYCFIQSYSPIDLYKIPLTFMEEFLSIMTRKSSILEKDINFFEIMDCLYERDICDEEETVGFLPFFAFYHTEFKNEFDREIDEMQDKNLFNEELIKMKYYFNKNRKNKYLIYSDYQLDNNLLMKYLNKINNLEKKQFNNIFYMTNSINDNQPDNILVIAIEEIIEKYSIKTNLLSESDLCCSAIILLFSLSLKFFDESKNCNDFLLRLFENFTIFRKYYSFLINMFYALFNYYFKKNDYAKVQSHLLLYFFTVNTLRNNKLIPNESLMNILKKFDKVNVGELFEKPKNKNKNSIDIKENIIEKNQIMDEKITKNNLYSIYNFNYKKFMTEKEILNTLKNESYKKDSKIGFHPKIRFQNNKLKIETDYFRQIKILDELVKVYNVFITNLDEEELNYKIVLDCCMNILIYIRNIDDFKNLTEINVFVEMIFFLFLNKYSQTNN